MSRPSQTLLFTADDQLSWPVTAVDIGYVVWVVLDGLAFYALHNLVMNLTASIEEMDQMLVCLLASSC